jgi:hypothetical protein
MKMIGLSIHLSKATDFGKKPHLHNVMIRIIMERVVEARLEIERR